MNRLQLIITGLNLRQKRMLLDLLDMHPVGGIRVEAETVYINHMLEIDLIHKVTGNTTDLLVYKLTTNGYEVARKLKGNK